MSAVLDKRARAAHVWERDEHDWYVEPEWCSRRLFEEETIPVPARIWDPACGMGRIVNAALAAGHNAGGSDIVERWRDGALLRLKRDFLTDDIGMQVDAIVSNPPFAQSEEFVRRALAMPGVIHVCMLLPITWGAGSKRARWLETTPLRRVWTITPRPSMPPGKVIEAGEKPGGGTKDFAWWCWLRGYDGRPEYRWLHRDRRQP